jgi:preprotein translocase subunit YajC
MGMNFLINDAYANATTAASTQGGGYSSILMLAVFIIFFYFLLWWPQNKRLKAHRQLISNLAKEDEVITGGGILGKITKINDDFLMIMIASNVEISIQKSSIVATVPKGTLKLS